VGKTYHYQPAGTITVTTTGNIDDLDFQKCAVVLMNNASTATLRGLKAGYPGQRVSVVSVGAGAVVFANNDSGSLAANRLAIPPGATTLTAGNGSATFAYNEVASRWRLVSYEPGTTSLNASDLTSGTVADARLSANVPLLNAANVFSANQRVNAGLGVNVAPPATGNVALSGGIFDYARAVALGSGVTPTYNASDFSGTSGTWTVDSGDIATFKYAYLGQFMVVLWGIDTSTINATGQLQILVPDGKTATATSIGNSTYNDGGGAVSFESGFAQIVNGGAFIQIFRPGLAAFINGTNNQTVRGFILFPI